MLFLKFNIIFLFLFLFNSYVYSGFTDIDCLDENFLIEVSHKGHPFGLMKNILNIKKDKCVITVHHEKMKYLKRQWLIDVCRGPVHIKYGTGAVEVFKRDGNCSGESDYCDSTKDLLTVISDDGLIFAPGEKEDITSDHGKIYCSYLLIRTYLNKGAIFSRHAKIEKGDNLLKDNISPLNNDPMLPISQVKETKKIKETKEIKDIKENVINKIDQE